VRQTMITSREPLGSLEVIVAFPGQLGHGFQGFRDLPERGNNNCINDEDDKLYIHVRLRTARVARIEECSEEVGTCERIDGLPRLLPIRAESYPISQSLGLAVKGLSVTSHLYASAS